MNNKQVLVYGVLESTNDLRSVFVGHIYFKKLMGQLNYKKPFELRSFSEIFYYGMTRLRNTNLGVLYSVSTQEPF